jgi:hypothetical protein
MHDNESTRPYEYEKTPPAFPRRSRYAAPRGHLLPRASSSDCHAFRGIAITFGHGAYK